MSVWDSAKLRWNNSSLTYFTRRKTKCRSTVKFAWLFKFCTLLFFGNSHILFPPSRRRLRIRRHRPLPPAQNPAKKGASLTSHYLDWSCWLGWLTDIIGRKKDTILLHEQHAIQKPFLLVLEPFGFFWARPRNDACFSHRYEVCVLSTLRWEWASIC